MPWDKVLHKFKAGNLKSSSGHKVTSRKQAIAIMLSEKRQAKDTPDYRPTRRRKASGV